MDLCHASNAVPLSDSWKVVARFPFYPQLTRQRSFTCASVTLIGFRYAACIKMY